MQFDQLERSIAHRRAIAAIYTRYLDSRIVSKTITQHIQKATNLRFPIFVDKRENLIAYLKKHGVFVRDIWYDTPIAPKKYMQQTNYTNQCPKSEEIANCILNLPTHRHVSEKYALYITLLVNTWLKSL